MLDTTGGRWLYRVPPVCASPRTIELGPAGADPGEASFDLVILPRTVDRELLVRAARLLCAGGIVAGCFENRYALARLRGAGNSAVPRASASSCRRDLAAAGFGEVRLFSIVPGIDDPMRLLAIEHRWSRRASIRHAHAMRRLVAPPTYLIWRILAEAGLSQHLGSAIFFWGRKPC